MTILHLALRSDWEQAQRAGSYRMSTRGIDLDTEGFIHASRPHQWAGVRERYYADLDDAELVLLEIDVAVLAEAGVEEREEPAAPGAEELFPHLYGPLPLGAVVREWELSEAPREG